MTDFDRLIQEKTELNRFDFKNSHWRKFARAAGIKTGGTVYAVAIAVVAAAGVATAILLSGKANTSKSQPAAPEKTPVIDTVLKDDLDNEPSILSADSIVKIAITAEKGTHSRDAAPADIPAVHEAESNTPEETGGKEREKGRNHGLVRPLTIKVDTIKDDIPTDEEIEKGHSRIIVQP